MTERSTCPDHPRPQALLAGALTAQAPQAVSRHVEACDRCQQTLEGLAGSSWADQVRALGEQEPPGPGLRQVMAQAVGSETVAAPEGDAAPGPDLPFLGAPAQPGHLGRLG